MIVESVVNLFFRLFLGFFGGLEFVKLPTELINALQSILVYGVWVVGADLFALFVGTIVAWWIIKFTIGLVVFVWELLPLT